MNNQTYQEDSTDVQQQPFLALMEQPGADTGVDDSGDEDTLSGDFLDLFDPEFFGYSQNDFALGLVVDEEDSELAQDVSDKLAHAAQRSLSNLRKGSRKKAELVSFSEDDFEGIQRDAFILIKDHKRMLFGANTKPAKQWKAIEWLFTAHDDGGPTFDLCCKAFNARIDVIRLRFHYEFFLRWFVSPVDFPFLTVPIPEIVAGQVIYIAGMDGLELAKLAWNKPGITTDEILDTLGHRPEYLAALNTLDEKFILCSQQGYWYLTGKNPQLLRKKMADERGRIDANIGGSIYWSRLF